MPDTPFIDAPPLPGWLEEALPFTRRVVQLDEYKVHFVDEGAGIPVLMVHGNPTWSFLWRKVIARLVPGFRCIAPDLVGLGLSDHPRSVKAHSFAMHAEVLRQFVDALQLEQFIIVGQDWGGPIAATAGVHFPERVVGAVFGNTTILPPHQRLRATWFHRFSHFPVVSTLAFRGFNFPVPILHKVQGDPRSIGKLEQRAYRYPLRHWRDRAAPLALARMVPNGFDHPTVALLKQCEAWAQDFEGPAALVWGLRDPILGRSLKRMKQAFPQARVTETQAGHFLQEEVPDEFAAAVRYVAAQVAE
jgi:haloalkane dehalogenase